MSGITWTKFFWSDWDTDPALRLCSFAAQGLWMRMLCIAASHDPIGYVAVAGRGLDETSIARMTGGEESEVRALLGELDRNGVFSRDRHGRIYSRRLVKDAKAASEARKNGKLGGNPTLGKNGGKSQGVNPQDKPPVKGVVKPQEPSATTKPRASKNALGLSGRGRADERAGGSSPHRAWNGPSDVREAFTTALGEDWCRSYLDPCQWQDVPERALVPATGLAGRKLVREGRKVLAALGLTVLEKAA